MDKDESLGQLYNVQNEIKILYKQMLGPINSYDSILEFDI